MCAMTLAWMLVISYVHTPLSEIAHSVRPMLEWARVWEEEVNLGAGEVPAGDDGDAFDFARMYSALARCIGFHRFFSLFNLTASRFQEKYYRNRPRRKNPILTVAIHVRRGDAVNKDDRGKWTEMADIAKTLRTAKKVLERLKRPYRIMAFSEGDPAEFRALEELGAELFLDIDALWTMREMVEADILIM